MKKKDNKNQFTIRYILNDNDNWQIFKETRLPKVVPVDMIDDVINQVEKALGCGNPENGYTLYKCLDCGHTHMVVFTCKSRFVRDVVKSI